MKPCVVILICAVVACACFGVQAQSNAPATNERDRAVEAVDVSVHADVDGQPHETGTVESSRERPTSLPTAKRPPASLVVWSAGADTSTTSAGEKAGQVTFGTSSFHSGTQMGASGAWQASASATSARAQNDDSGQGRSGLSNARPAHPLYGSSKPSLSLGTTVQPVSASDETLGVNALFGHTSFGQPSTGPFLKREFSEYKDQASAKRHEQRVRKRTN